MGIFGFLIWIFGWLVMVLVAVFLMVGGGGFGGFFLPNLEFWVVDGGLCNCACIWWVLRTRNFFLQRNKH